MSGQSPICACGRTRDHIRIKTTGCGPVAPRKVYKPDGYTVADQRADTAFLVGVQYGRESERARMLAEGYVNPPAAPDAPTT